MVRYTLEHLSEKLDKLLKTQESTNREIGHIKEIIDKLKADAAGENINSSDVPSTPHEEEPILIENKYVGSIQSADKDVKEKSNKPEQGKSNLENLIGGNIVNKLGIIILLAGIGILVKYAIDHDLFKPVVRIAIGYFSGISLLGIALFLKNNYKNYSAVLLSGGMAIFYFTTFAAYEFYQFYTDAPTFLFMTVLTALTVYAAVKYDSEVIGIYGLVGAYAIPFLVGNVYNNPTLLFVYMLVINSGILILAFRKYWKRLNYSAFIFTWLIFSTWYLMDYPSAFNNKGILLFAFSYFAIFYGATITFKLTSPGKFILTDVALLLLNAFIFYALGYYYVDHLTEGRFTGLFTLGNTIIHALAAFLFYHIQKADRNIFLLLSGLCITFFTIAIPVQLEGNWVTLLWAGEALILFYIGRRQKVLFYEVLAYILICLASISLLIDWNSMYMTSKYNISPGMNFLLNPAFLTTFLVIVAFSFINYIHFQRPGISPVGSNFFYSYLINPGLVILLFCIFYYGFRFEISNFWYQKYQSGMIIGGTSEINYDLYNEAIPAFRNISLFIYSALLISTISLVHVKLLQLKKITLFLTIISVLVIIKFLISGLSALSSLRQLYLDQQYVEFYYRGKLLLMARYLAFAALVVMLFSIYKALRQLYVGTKLLKVYLIFANFVILVVLSNELFNILHLYHSPIENRSSFRIGLTILWGAYSLVMIAIGFRYRLKVLRLTAFFLFLITLIKLLLFDLAGITTLGKTIVLSAMGILLLVVSFLYQKYKDIILMNDNE